MKSFISVALLVSFVFVSAAPQARAEWSTGGKILAGGAVALGGYLLYRAYRNAETRRENEINEILSDRPYRYQSSYDDDPGSAPSYYYSTRGDGDSTYDAWLAQQNEQKLRIQEYNNQMAANAAKFRSLSGTLKARVQALRSSDAAWVCASLCGTYNGPDLIAKEVESTGGTIKEAQANIDAKCKGKAYLFTSIASPKQNYELVYNPGACFAVKTDDAKMLQETVDTGQGVKAKIVVTDIELVPDSTPVSAAFKHELLNGAQFIMKALEGGDVSASIKKAEQDGVQADPDLMKELAAIHPVPKQSRPGHLVMSNEDPDPARNVLVVADVAAPGVGKETATLAMTVTHSCGPETHTVKLHVVALVGPAMKSTAYKGSDHLLQMYQEAFNATVDSGADGFCPSSDHDTGVVKQANPPAAPTLAREGAGRMTAVQ